MIGPSWGSERKGEAGGWPPARWHIKTSLYGNLSSVKCARRRKPATGDLLGSQDAQNSVVGPTGSRHFRRHPFPADLRRAAVLHPVGVDGPDSAAGGLSLCQQ